jgi:inositol transport system ATP-binding protein
MNILIGMIQSDEGDILLEGTVVRIRNPHDAARRGISMVHQELMPFPDLTIAENMYMGHEPLSWFPGWIDRHRMNQSAAQMLRSLGVSLPIQQTMRSLRVSEIQIVEIAKALAHKAKVIILDEPTSALSEQEAAKLLTILRDLRNHGATILYISHRLDEIFQIADKVTVLRDGKHVVTCSCQELNRDRMINLIVGEQMINSFGVSRPHQQEVILQVEHICRDRVISDVSFQIRRGEVLGIAGLMGAGKTELLQSIYGLMPIDTGQIRVRGKPAIIRNPSDAIAHGIAMVTDDRKMYGLVPKMSLKHNITLSALWRYCVGPWIHYGKENAAANSSIQAFGIRAPSHEFVVDHLSGGNQQKVIFAKSLLNQPDILLLDEPTQGIDIAAKTEIYETIRRLASDGKAVAIASSEIPEIIRVSHRILVMRQGRIVAECETSKTSQEEIVRLSMPLRVVNIDMGNEDAGDRKGMKSL